MRKTYVQKEYQIDTIHNAQKYYQTRIDHNENKFIDGLDLRPSISGKPFAWVEIGSLWFLFVQEDDTYDIYYVSLENGNAVILKKEKIPITNEALSSLFAFSKGDTILYDLAKHEYNPIVFMLVLYDCKGEVKLAFDQNTIGAFKDTMENTSGIYEKDSLPLTIAQGKLIVNLINSAVGLSKWYEP